MADAATDDSLGLTGRLLDRKYRVGAPVAEGGFGVVYAGQHIGLGRPVAIKALKAEPATGSDDRGELIAQFLEEARLAARLRHPAVVEVLDTGVALTEHHPEGVPWIAMEWLDGETLAADLARRHAHGERGRSPAEVMGLLRPVVEALAEAHDAGIVHRDLTPNNVMLVPGRAGLMARILDFGIAKRMRPDAGPPGPATRTATAARAFSLAYAAPEQLSGARTGPWTDVHALGLLFSELLCGRRSIAADDVDAHYRAAFDPSRPTPATRGVDAGAWEPILARALALDPAERHASAGALLVALDAAGVPPMPRLVATAVTARSDPSETISASRVVAAVLGELSAPRWIVVCECGRLTAPALRIALDEIDELAIGRGAQRGVIRRGRAAVLSLPDREISRQHLAIRRRATGWEAVDLGSKNGIAVNGEPARSAALGDGDLVEAGGTLMMFRDEGALVDTDRDRIAEPSAPLGLATVHLELEQRFTAVLAAAAAGATVLVRGEPGSGAPELAQAIHARSGRSGALIEIGCAGVAPGDAERALGEPVRRALAAGGTVLLDDVAELPDDAQAALGRLLAEHPAGIVAATRHDLAARVAERRFRAEPAARLTGAVIDLPPLRDRREDLGTWIAAALARLGVDAGADVEYTLDRAAARALLGHAWPGNLVELDQVLRSAIAAADRGRIGLAQLPEAIRGHASSLLVGQGRRAALRPEDRVLRDRVLELLGEHRGDACAVASAIGMAPLQFGRLCRRLQIDLAEFAAAPPL